MTRLRWLALLLCAVLPWTAAAQPASQPPAVLAPDYILDADARAALERFHLAGIALGVIEDGKVTYARGFGETVAGSGDPVTTETLFKIASNSKAMTAAVLARLVQAGKLRWDDPVVRHLPQFAMHDPEVTRTITVGDLLVHNSGLPEGGGDLMLWPEPNLFTRADIIQGLRHIKPAYPFRSGYAYDNLLYVVAGEVAAAVGGASYEELVRRELFQPLGLDSCRVGEFSRSEAGSVAQPHWYDGERVLPMRQDPEIVPAITSAAAGGIRCSLDDMLAWALNWLAPTPEQLRWLGPEQRAAMWTPRTPMPISAFRREWDDTTEYAYAYGFRIADIHGEHTVSHTGTLGGMYSMMMLLPDRRSGFVFMINGNGGRARTVLAASLTRLFTMPMDEMGFEDIADAIYGDGAAPETAEEGPRLPDIATRTPVSPAAMQQWLGTWRDPWFGEVRICAVGDEVEWRSAKSPKMHGRVSLLQGRHFLHWDDPGVDLDAWLDFSGEGDARRLHMAKLDPEGDFSSDYEDLAFVRTGDCPETMADAGLVDIRALVPDLPQDIRYAGSDNFVGAPVDGYDAPRCLLAVDAAAALARVDATLRDQGYRLKPFDCYRPARAVAHFVRWAADLSDQRTKAAHYPALDKSALLGEYIAAVSGHSRGRTVDLTLVQCTPAGNCTELDMGTPFDFFDPRANTDSPAIAPAQRENRQRLLAAMQAEGFRNYPMEWWHFTLQPETGPDVTQDEAIHDVPITAGDANPAGAIEALMQRYEGNVPGASLLVLRDGEPVVRRGFGLSDLAQGTEAGPATNYRLASVSKQFTAAAILLLAQDGALSVDDPVRDWLPSLPASADPITLRHLLTHTSGLVDYEDLMGDDWQGQIRDAGVLALLEREPGLYFPPGSAYRYSNGGYALLALVVEKASGMGYPEFLDRRIFEPLGMHDTVAYVAGGAEVPHRAWGYSIDWAGGWERTDQSSTSAVLGDGGIYSSIDDLARWDAALYDDRLLSDASRALAFAPHVEVTGEPHRAAYGFGWRITGDTLWHSGETIGFRNVIVRWPEQRLTVILLSNRNDPEPYATALKIGALFR